ncbi:hypothetical protein H6784_00250 [Candidatus Nomurabacteria bacterium]|nr:hypothetical protein [Candidatus Nomurabacteria bacterium]
MSSVINNTLRTALMMLLILPMLVFAQAEDRAINEPVESPAPPAFLENVQSEEDFNNLTAEQQAETNQYFDELSRVSTVIANVNIQDLSIVSQDKNVFNVSFELANGTGVQTGVKYSVSLIRETDQGQFKMDTKIYPEVLTLSENSTIKKSITYTAPTGLNGEYTLLVESRTKGGLTLGIGVAGSVVLVTDTKGLEILTDTCSMQVEGEEGSPTYILPQGVDVTPEENLLLTCDVTNYAPASVSVTTSFETHFRTMFGEIVPDKGGIVESIQFAGNETKTVTFVLPQATAPQAYDIKVSLKNDELETNSVVVHYVLVGSSATIQNVILDKSSYQVGDTANISFIWSPSADSFPDSRHEASSPTAVALDVSITSSGVDCISSQTTPLDANTIKQELAFPVTADCAYPLLSLSLKDATGNVLDDSMLAPNGEPPVVSAVPVSDDSSNNNVILVLLATLFFIVLLVYAYIRRSSANDVVEDVVLKSLLLLLLVGGVFVGGIDRVEASVGVTFTGETQTVCFGRFGSFPCWQNDSVNTVSIDKAVYAPGETINFTTTVTLNACSNTVRTSIVRAQLNSQLFPIFSVQSRGGIPLVQFATTNAPMTPGVYRMIYTSQIVGMRSRGSASVNITVAAPACVANAGTPCTSAANACGTTQQGTIQCNGSCSVGAPANPAGLGSLCSSAANICGLTTPGTQQCNGSCSATAAPSNNLCPAIGSFEGVDTAACKVRGWTYDPSDSTQSIDVHVYQDNSAFAGGTFVAACTASMLRNDVNNFYGITGNHGFDCTLPSSYLGTGNHNLYIHAIDTTGSPNNVISNSPRALSCALPPSGNISVGTCFIQPGDTTCNANVTWNTANFLGAVKVLVNANPNSVSGAATNPLGFNVPVSYGANTVTLRDIGSSFTVSDTTNIGCVAGSVWVDPTVGCLQLPVMKVNSNQDTIRNGEEGTGTISVNSRYKLNCSVVGAEVNSASTFVHDGTVVSNQNYPFLTQPLTSAQIVQVECVHQQYSIVKDDAQGRINVTASVEER